MLDAAQIPTIDGQPSSRQEAVIYTRVSSKDQERGGFSIPAQSKLLRRYALERGISVTAEYSDIETAGRAGRVEFGAMVHHLKENKLCKSILVEKTDRLYRNLKDWVILDELGVQVHLVKEGVVLCEDSVSSEKFVHGIKVLMAKNYVDNLSEEVRKGMLEKAQQGQWPARAPIGYRNTTDIAGKRVIEPDPEQATLIAKLFESCATGEHSLTKLTEIADSAGLTSSRTHKTLQRSRIHSVLRNPIYMGEFDWNGVRYKGAHEPLVTRKTWECVQEILSGRAPHRRNKRRRHCFTFSGLIHCGVCAEENKRFLLVGEIKKRKYIYYRCEECKRLHRAFYVREEQVIEAYTAALTGIEIDCHQLTEIHNALNGSDTRFDNSLKDKITRARAELASLQSRLDLAYDDRLAGRIDPAYFSQRASVWRHQVELLVNEIKELEEQDQSTSASTPNQLPLKLELRQLSDLFRETNIPTNRRRIIEILYSNSSWKDGKLTAIQS